MIAPKITLSQLLWCMVGVAIFLALVSTAWRGNLVTFGQSVAIALLPLVFLCYAISYWLLFAIANGTRQNLSRSRNGSVESEHDEAVERIK